MKNSQKTCHDGHDRCPDILDLLDINVAGSIPSKIAKRNLIVKYSNAYQSTLREKINKIFRLLKKTIRGHSTIDTI